MPVRIDGTPDGPRSGFRFSQQSRLKSPTIIRQILTDRASSRRRSDAFRVIWRARVDPSLNATPRFAFVISRDAGSAVTRNRIRRRLREAVRLQPDRWPQRPTDVIFRVNSNRADEIPFAKLAIEVTEALDVVSESVGERVG